VNPKLGLLERIALGLALTISLTIALSRSPLWHGADFIAAVLAENYATLLEGLPGRPHTTLAFLILIILIHAGLFVPNRPLLIPSIVTAAALGIAAYPWSVIRWHQVFPDVFGTPRSLGPLDWIFLALPILILLAAAALMQIRATLHHYETKELHASDLRPIRLHLTREALLLGAIAVGLTLAGGILLALATNLPTPGVLRENPLLVILTAILLVIAGIITGTRLLARHND
jgi:hypothetical protein